MTKERRTIDIERFRRGFRGNIQRLQDHLRACHGGLETLTPQAYADALPEYVFVVAPEAVMDFQTALSFSAHWLSRSFFRDVVDQVHRYLDHCFDAFVFMEHVKGPLKVTQEAGRKRFIAFKKLGMPAKFDALRDQFDAAIPLRGHVLSVNAVRNCLVHRLGVVSQDDLDKDGKLELRLRRCRLHITDSATGVTSEAVFGKRYDDATATNVFDDSLRTFSIGEHLTFSRRELFDCTLTMATFDQSMAPAFGHVADKFGIAYGPPSVI